MTDIERKFRFVLDHDELMASTRIVTDEQIDASDPLEPCESDFQFNEDYQFEEQLRNWISDNDWFIIEWPSPHHMILTTKTIPQRKFSLRISELNNEED